MKTCNGRAIGLLVGKKSKDRDRRKGKEREGDRERYGTTGGRTIMPVEVRGGMLCPVNGVGRYILW